jgi:hypothetical protein
MGLFSGISGGNAARGLREQAHQLKAQQFRETEMLRLQTDAVNAQRLDLFEKDRLSAAAEQFAMEQLNTPGAQVLMGTDPDLVRQRRAGFYAQSTTATV